MSIEHQMAMLSRSLQDAEHLLKELSTVKAERDDFLRKLQLFWAAKDRPWFCRKCSTGDDHGGRLMPFGQYGFKCAKCGTEYEEVSE